MDRDPLLAAKEADLGFDRVLNVELTHHHPEVVYRELVLCLQLLPKLHTFQIMSFPAGYGNYGDPKTYYLDHDCMEHLQRAFSSIAPVYRVHTVTLLRALIPFIDLKRLFPSLRQMAIHTTGSDSLHNYFSRLSGIPECIHTLTLPSGLASLLVLNTYGKQHSAFLVSTLVGRL